MTVKEIIKTLESQGHKVDYRQRSDGGILIKNIDGVSYKGAAGNTVARQMTGQALSSMQFEQLKSITPKAKTNKAKSRKKGFTKLDEDLEKQLKKTQRIWNKEKPAVKEGRIKKSHIRYIAEHEGIKAAFEALSKAEKYAKGYAYEENVQFLADRLRRLLFHDPEPETATRVENLAKYIESIKDNFKEEWIDPCNTEIYVADEMGDTWSIDNCVYNICIIINKEYNDLD